MADAFTSLHCHVLFSTKGREPWLRLDMQERVWACLGGIARQNQLRPLLIGGTEDHIHVLLGIPPTVAVCGIDKASRGVQASLARRDGYGPLIPWAEAPRLPSNHRFAVPQCACDGAHTAGWKSLPGGTFTRLKPKATASWQHEVESCRR